MLAQQGQIVDLLAAIARGDHHAADRQHGLAGPDGLSQRAQDGPRAGEGLVLTAGSWTGCGGGALPSTESSELEQ